MTTNLPLGFSETPSGLLTPTTAPKREVWSREDGRFLGRLMRWAETHRLVIPALICEKCKEPLVGYDKPNHFTWECDCTAREMAK